MHAARCSMQVNFTPLDKSRSVGSQPKELVCAWYRAYAYSLARDLSQQWLVSIINEDGCSVPQLAWSGSSFWQFVGHDNFGEASLEQSANHPKVEPFVAFKPVAHLADLYGVVLGICVLSHLCTTTKEFARTRLWRCWDINTFASIRLTAAATITKASFHAHTPLDRNWALRQTQRQRNSPKQLVCATPENATCFRDYFCCQVTFKKSLKTGVNKITMKN